MLTSILLGILRHVLTTSGGAIAAYGLQVVGGIPQVHNLTAVVTGGLLVAVGTVKSVLSKVKTESGPVYKFNN